MDIFKMAAQIANNMSEDDKSAIENMDMEKMISHVTKNVFKMMNNIPGESDVDTRPSEKKVEFLEKTRDICFDLNVDLDDFYTSKKKKINIKRRRVVVVNGVEKMVEEKKKLVINIERGMKDEQQIVFKGESDQIPGYESGDVIITLIENEHPVFQRENDNLIIVKNVNLYQIYDYTFDITHLDSRIIRVSKQPNDALHLNDALRKIVGNGMPIYKQNGKFGDLFVRFNVVIPKTIESGSLKNLKEIFDEPENLSDTFNQEAMLENVTEEDMEELELINSDSDSDSESDLSSVSSVSSVSSDSSEEPRHRRR